MMIDSLSSISKIVSFILPFPLFFNILEYLLTEEQYTFLAAKTKKEAQDLLASRQVDLVLLDVSLSAPRSNPSTTSFSSSFAVRKMTGAMSCSLIFLHRYRDGEQIAVTKLEYKILMTLFSNPHKIFTREEILNGIWDMAGNFVNDNTLTVTMKRLREKLGDKEGNVIVTVRGIGYRLNL